MKNKKTAKTNAMRILDRKGFSYEFKSYEVSQDDLSGVHAAAEMGEDPETVFKTLVLLGEPGGYFVCCIPVAEELDLKKAARASGNKRCSMLHVKDLKDITGYIRGGCSPIGMKKQFPTYIHSSAASLPAIYISAGVRGLQLKIAPAELIAFVGATVAEISRRE